MDEAQELVDASSSKSTLYGGGFGKTQQTAGIGHLVSILLSAASPETGRTQQTSFLYGSETMARLELHEPTVSLRINKNTPKEIWEWQWRHPCV